MKAVKQPPLVLMLTFRDGSTWNSSFDAFRITNQQEHVRVALEYTKNLGFVTHFGSVLDQHLGQCVDCSITQGQEVLASFQGTLSGKGYRVSNVGAWFLFHSLGFVSSLRKVASE